MSSMSCTEKTCVNVTHKLIVGNDIGLRTDVFEAVVLCVEVALENETPDDTYNSRLLILNFDGCSPP